MVSWGWSTLLPSRLHHGRGGEKVAWKKEHLDQVLLGAHHHLQCWQGVLHHSFGSQKFYELHLHVQNLFEGASVIEAYSRGGIGKTAKRGGDRDRLLMALRPSREREKSIRASMEWESMSSQPSDGPTKGLAACLIQDLVLAQSVQSWSPSMLQTSGENHGGVQTQRGAHTHSKTTKSKYTTQQLQWETNHPPSALVMGKIHRLKYTSWLCSTGFPPTTRKVVNSSKTCVPGITKS